jgi:hypothetical protein
MRFIAMDSVSCASGLSAPSEMPGRDQPLADLGNALDLLQRDRLAALRAEVQQVRRATALLAHQSL